MWDELAEIYMTEESEDETTGVVNGAQLSKCEVYSLVKHSRLFSPVDTVKYV